ncbi:MAG: HAMP domain-containing protein [Planctomycetota bacterium]|nr:MAG: HAMP domain-containing protein [Planctomycetota bacterium]
MAKQRNATERPRSPTQRQPAGTSRPRGGTQVPAKRRPTGTGTGPLATASSSQISTISGRQGTVSKSRSLKTNQSMTDSHSVIRRREMQFKGRSLRSTLMLAMVGMTAVTMILMGLVLSSVSSSFLIGQAQHKGIELAKMAAQVGRSVIDSGGSAAENEIRLKRYFDQATTWGDTADTFSDIIGITFVEGQLAGLSWGEDITTRSQGPQLQRINLPRLGWVRLSDDIVVNRTSRNNAPVFRFRVKMNARDGAGYLGSTVWLDLAADKVMSVRNRLFFIVGIAVILSMGIVFFLAIWIAGKITRPLQILVRDMEIVGQGNLDHQTRATSKDEIGHLANSFNRMTRELKGAQSALVEQEKAEYELSIAREVQQQLLPAEAPAIPGYLPYAYYKGAKAVSGDYYDFIPLGNDLWGFIIADVSGKGVPGSMVMAITRTIIRLVANKHQQHAAETLKETNRLIAKQIKRGMFVTAFYCVLNTRNGQMTYASAGHNPMLIYRAASRSYELAAPKGIAIGFNDGPIFDKNIQQFESQLQVGDSLVIYTDGFPEAMNENNEEFGDDRFNDLIGSHGHLGAKGLIDTMIQEVTAHRGRAAQSDDLTVIAVSRVQ